MEAEKGSVLYLPVPSTNSADIGGANVVDTLKTQEGGG